MKTPVPARRRPARPRRFPTGPAPKTPRGHRRPSPRPRPGRLGQLIESNGAMVYPNQGMSKGLAQLPRHVAIIMDGNGRWAQHRNLPRVEGHRRGARSVKEVVRAAREIGLRALTLSAFSSQHWDRPPDEVATLMQLLRDYVIDERAEIMENG